MISQRFFISFFLIIAVLYSSSLFVSPIALAQETLDDTFTSDGSTQSVTSTYDAVLKAMLIISQVALVGLIFNHLILQRALRKNKKAQEISVVQFVSTHFNHSSGRLAVFLLICCISIIAFSTGLMLLSSYELAQNLELDISSAFDILYSTSVGQVWTLRIVTSFMIIGIIISYHIIIRRNINKKKRFNHKKDQDPDQITYRYSYSYDKWYRILLVSILVLSSFNLYSNSMVGHSNSLDSFSPVAVSVDWIHFMSVSIWIGGIFYLAILFTKWNSIIPNETNTLDKHIVVNSPQKGALEQMNKVLMYFSYIAITAISIIGITGLYLAFVHIQNLSFLITSVYGQILIIKLSLAFSMIFIGRYNQIKIYNHTKLIFSTNNVNIKGNSEKYEHSVLKSNSKVFLKKINKSLKIESVLGILVLVSASFLSVTSPPSLEPLNQDLNSSNVNVTNTGNMLTSNLMLLYIVTTLSIMILIFGIVNFRKNQKQIKEVISLSTTQRDKDRS